MPGLTLTFVDDSEADHFLIRDAAEALEWPVHTQHFLHAGQFLTALDHGEVRQDAVITDLNMPGPTGFDLIGALRARPKWREMPVLVFTTSASAADRAQSAGLGVAGYFVKPVSYEALVGQLKDMVDLVRRRVSGGVHKVG